MNLITRPEEKARIVAAIEKAKTGTRSGNKHTATSGPFATCEYEGQCEVTFIYGSDFMVKRALSGQWTGYYAGGTLRHEERH